MGGCLQALHSNCPDEVVKLTAADLVSVFPESMRRTRSPELKVNFVLPFFFIHDYLQLDINQIIEGFG